MFDSNEERYFYNLLLIIKDLGYIETINMQPEPFVISNKYKDLIKDKIYTTDIKVVWKENAKGVFVSSHEEDLRTPFISNGLTSYIEIKPEIDRYNMTRLAKSNISYIWMLYKQYIQLVVVGNTSGFFKDWFTTKEYIDSQKYKRTDKSKIKYNAVTIEQFLKGEYSYNPKPVRGTIKKNKRK